MLASSVSPANAGSPIQVIRSWESPNSNPASNFVYFEYEYTKGVEFWALNEITSITCSPSVGTCLDKGAYTLSWAPASRFPTIRVADLPNSDPFTVTINISTAPKSNLTNITTESLTHYYRYNSPVSGHDLTPTVVSNYENPVVGNSLSIVLRSQRRYTDTHIYTSAHSCFVTGATCDTSQIFNQDGTYTITLQITNYIQGQSITVTINRHWTGQNYINETLTDPSEGTHVSNFTFETLKPGLNPQIADLKSEIAGCSFRIINYDPNFRFGFKRLDTDISISTDGFVRLSGQADGSSVEDYIASSRTGFLTVNNLPPFVCSAFTEAVRGKIEEEARIEAIRIAEAEAARLAEIRRQNAIGDLINIQLSNVIPISTFRDAGVWSVLPETVEQLSKFIFTLDKSSRSDIQLIEKKSKEFRTEYFHSKLEQEISYINLINLEFTNLSERLLPELKIVLDREKYVKEKDYKSIQKSIDMLNILFQGRDYGTLGESQLSKIGVKISLSNKKSEVLMKFRSQPSDVFRDPGTVQVAISQIEKVIQDRLDRTIAAKERTRAILEKIRARSASRGG
jgi:hypothetical protein